MLRGATTTAGESERSGGATGGAEDKQQAGPGRLSSFATVESIEAAAAAFGIKPKGEPAAAVATPETPPKPTSQTTAPLQEDSPSDSSPGTDGGGRETPFYSANSETDLHALLR